jgi:hypothetical protein
VGEGVVFSPFPLPSPPSLIDTLRDDLDLRRCTDSP